jgi:hypothetical protein
MKRAVLLSLVLSLVSLAIAGCRYEGEIDPDGNAASYVR